VLLDRADVGADRRSHARLAAAPTHDARSVGAGARKKEGPVRIFFIAQTAAHDDQHPCAFSHSVSDIMCAPSKTSERLASDVLREVRTLQ
jgi:hypothetical protein